MATNKTTMKGSSAMGNAIAPGSRPLAKRPRRRLLAPRRPSHEDNTLATESLARKETRAVKILRACVVVVLLVSAAAVSIGVYQVMRQEEHQDFANNFQDNALQLVNAFHEGLERNVGAVASMSTAITSYANQANLSFPLVTVPDFEIIGSNVRVQSGSNMVVYAPLVTEETRSEWEAYALEKRGHIDKAFEKDTQYRLEQDAELGKNQTHSRQLDEDNAGPTVLEDGTGYHSKIWGSQDARAGSGSYHLPIWQRSPIDDRRQAVLNFDTAPSEALIPDLDAFLSEKKAIFNEATILSSSESQQWFEDVLMISQMRHKMGKYVNDLHTYLVYPVFGSFDSDTRQVAGILITDIFWKFLFRNLLPSTSVGIICVIENSFGQVFSYRIDGPEVTFLEMGDAHDPKYDDQEVSEDVMSFIEDNAGAHNRAYKTVGMSNLTRYRIRVFPSKDTEQLYVSNRPLMYALVLVMVFTFACVLLITYACLVEKRQVLMMKQVIENAKRATQVERDLNEFLAHEVRNPLSAAISASTFVASAVNEAEPLVDPETRRHVREDIDVVSASLTFINDFLIGMLDIYKATGNEIAVEMRPADVKRDIFLPVAHMLNKRTASFQVIVDCPDNLVVLTDTIRLKQVVLSLIRNAAEFVQDGFIRMRADAKDHLVVLYVEDSGPGVRPDKRGDLFSKYTQTLDLLSQGQGIGLNLSKKLMEIMNGDLYLDESYHSGVEGAPGARFVIPLKTEPLGMGASLPFPDIESGLFGQSFQDGTQSTVDCSACSHDFSRRRFSSKEVPIEVQQGTVAPSLPEEPEQSEEPSLQLPEELSCLFVDDDAMLRKLFMRAIKKVAPSWNVQQAASGEAAMQICEQSSTPFGLIFMDQYMTSTEKGMTGTETVEAMRSKGMDSKICGLSANDVKIEFIQAGADSFMLKPMPCKPPDLKTALLKILHSEPMQK